MKNAATGIGLAILGIGIAVNGLNLNGNQANATTASMNEGPDEQAATVAEYITLYYEAYGGQDYLHHYRFWSNGIVDFVMGDCAGWSSECVEGWTLLEEVSSGYVANTDVTGDGKIDGEDLGVILANYGSTSATLLVNPDLGDATVVGASMTGFPWYGSNGGQRPATRLWSSGLIEMGYLKWYTRSQFEECIPVEHPPQESGQILCDNLSWHPVPASLPAQMRLGDINRDNEVSGGDLGLLLGDWK